MYELVKPKVEASEIKGNYGCFSIQPLERGFGVTLGNSLRRVLLSSLPGAAVTKLKVEDAAHEFSVIPHMKEDIIDFVLNVKSLRMRPLSNRESKLILSVEGGGCVCGADIAPSADFEIVNPELHLATLESDEAKLNVELSAEIGKGYMAAPHSNGLPIGVIPVDAIFTPVSKVSYSVESIRIGQQVGYENLIIEIWTDGAVTPREALSRGAEILVNQFSMLSLSAEPSVEEESKQLSTVSQSIYEMPIEQVGLTQSIVRRLRRNKITKLGELLEKSREDLLALEKFGAKSVEEVEKCIQGLGFYLASKDGVGSGAPVMDAQEEMVEENKSDDLGDGD